MPTIWKPPGKNFLGEGPEKTTKKRRGSHHNRRKRSLGKQSWEREESKCGTVSGVKRGGKKGGTFKSGTVVKIRPDRPKKRPRGRPLKPKFMAKEELGD